MPKWLEKFVTALSIELIIQWGGILLAVIVAIWQWIIGSGPQVILVSAVSLILVVFVLSKVVADWRARKHPETVTQTTQSIPASALYVLTVCVLVVAALTLYVLHIDREPAQLVATPAPSPDDIVDKWIERTGFDNTPDPIPTVEATVLEWAREAATRPKKESPYYEGLRFQYWIKLSERIDIYSRGADPGNLLVTESSIVLQNSNDFGRCWNKLSQPEKNRRIADIQREVSLFVDRVKIDATGPDKAYPGVPRIRIIRRIDVDVTRSNAWFLLELEELERAHRIARDFYIASCS